ncbi:hypothetical protein [Fulvimonas soli]|uniref:Uncharacterized protein n=1 Tax=Fulvimonas soli TaxID=155197 RepID=A0A316HX05_9GAMM|nr:hypothetical protein [Fulvimonas soli]PWK85247.1 hypothetical protein C7456_10921 [Fulvimonas soli]TNY25328.1 hypothetical protein BV497_14455 [Fulvimonas soli]
MRLFSQLIALSRSRQLGRQFKEIERCIKALPRQARARLGIQTLREIGQASRMEFPHLYGTAPEARYLPWGQGTEIGYARALSDNPEVALRGIALWLAVAYHETKDCTHAALQAQHRQLLRVVRELKESHRGGDPVQEWMNTGAAA